jgi:hypothetical protein
MQTVKVKVKKSLINKKLLKLLTNILLQSQKMLKDKVKTSIVMMMKIIQIVTLILWNKLLLNLTQVWDVNAQQQKNLNKL